MAKTNALRVHSGLNVGGNAADVRGLLDLAAKPGNGQKFVELSADLIRAGKLRWEDVDMLALFRATIDVPVEVRAQIAGIGERTLSTSAFPILAGNLTAELLERQDESVETIWQDLVTVRDTNKETTHLVRIVNSDTSHTGGRRRLEGDPYPLMTSSEERVQVDTVEDGRRVAITAKLLEVNDKAGFMEQVIALRQWAMNRRDRVTLHRIFDVHGSAASPAAPYVYRPNGSGTALYTTSTTALSRAPSGTRLNNNALVDGSDIQAVIDVLANMRDELGYRVSKIGALDLVVPHALRATLEKVIKSEMTPGVENEFNPYGPKGSYQIRIHSSPKIDDFTTSVWLASRGPIAQQFTLVSRLNMEYVSMAASMTDFLRNRLAYEARVADEFEVAARDHNRVVQSLPATTAITAPTLGS
jgi:hypothetical protein